MSCHRMWHKDRASLIMVLLPFYGVASKDRSRTESSKDKEEWPGCISRSLCSAVLILFDANAVKAIIFSQFATH